MAALAVSRGAGLLEPEPTALGEQVEDRVDRLEERVENLARSLESVEERFEGYNAALALYEGRLREAERLLAAAGMIGAWKASTCRYQVEGVCTLWRLGREAAEKLGDAVRVDDQGVARVDVARAPWFCALCPMYSRRGGGRQA